MARMKAVQVGKAGGSFEFVERNIPDPSRGQVRIKVEACGICHSDVLVKEGLWPGIQYPRVPGHEIAGRIDAVGADVTNWQPGEGVGVGWHGGHCKPRSLTPLSRRQSARTSVPGATRVRLCSWDATPSAAALSRINPITSTPPVPTAPPEHS